MILNYHLYGLQSKVDGGNCTLCNPWSPYSGVPTIAVVLDLAACVQGKHVVGCINGLDEEHGSYSLVNGGWEEQEEVWHLTTGCSATSR